MSVLLCALRVVSFGTFGECKLLHYREPHMHRRCLSHDMRVVCIAPTFWHWLKAARDKITPWAITTPPFYNFLHTKNIFHLPKESAGIGECEISRNAAVLHFNRPRNTQPSLLSCPRKQGSLIVLDIWIKSPEWNAVHDGHRVKCRGT